MLLTELVLVLNSSVLADITVLYTINPPCCGPSESLLSSRISLADKLRREENLITLDLGGTWVEGNDRLLGELGYDAMAVGTRDLVEIGRRLSDMPFPFVCANIQVCTDSLCIPLVSPYKMVRRKENDICVVGVLGGVEWSSIPDSVRKNFHFIPPLDILSSYEPIFIGSRRGGSNLV